MANKKLMIVIEETGEESGKGFKIYLDGDKQRIGKIDSDKLSPAEFWGNALFGVVIEKMAKVNAIKIINSKEDNTFSENEKVLFVVWFSNKAPIFCEENGLECYKTWEGYVGHEKLSGEAYLKAVRSL